MHVIGGGPTVKILEIRQLDPLPHTENVSGSAKTVDQHPYITRIKSGDLGSCIRTVLQSVLDISPRSDDRTENHKTKGEQRESCHGATKPEHLPVSDKDDR